MLAPAPRRRLSHAERRAQILETTLLCLARDGADRTSLRSVCREAGIAPSLIKHFFAGWHELLASAYALLTERFLANLAPVTLADLPSAQARMAALIARYLSLNWQGESTIGASIAFWQLSRSVPELRPQFMRSLEDRTRMLQLVLAGLAAERQAPADTAALTTCFMLMLDGIWLEQATNPGAISGEAAAQLCWTFLDAALPLKPALPAPALAPAPACPD